MRCYSARYFVFWSPLEESPAFQQHLAFGRLGESAPVDLSTYGSTASHTFPPPRSFTNPPKAKLKLGGRSANDPAMSSIRISGPENVTYLILVGLGAFVGAFLIPVGIVYYVRRKYPRQRGFAYRFGSCCGSRFGKKDIEAQPSTGERRTPAQGDPLFHIFSFTANRQDERTRPPELDAVETALLVPHELDGERPVRELEAPLESPKPVRKKTRTGGRAELDGNEILEC